MVMVDTWLSKESGGLFTIRKSFVIEFPSTLMSLDAVETVLDVQSVLSCSLSTSFPDRALAI